MGDGRIYFTRGTSCHRALLFVAFKAALSSFIILLATEIMLALTIHLRFFISLSTIGMLSLEFSSQRHFICAITKESWSHGRKKLERGRLVFCTFDVKAIYSGYQYLLSREGPNLVLFLDTIPCPNQNIPNSDLRASFLLSTGLTLLSARLTLLDIASLLLRGFDVFPFDAKRPDDGKA